MTDLDKLNDIYVDYEDKIKQNSIPQLLINFKNHYNIINNPTHKKYNQEIKLLTEEYWLFFLNVRDELGQLVNNLNKLNS